MNKLTFVIMTGCVALGLSTASYASPEVNNNAIRIDGSSTVYPITEAVSEKFGNEPANKAVRVTVGISGTGGGFQKFCKGETDISDASRPIKQAEIDACKAGKIDYVELPVAYDALTVVVNSKNDWAKSMTVAELKQIWQPEAQGKLTHWNQVRPEWPDKPLRLYGPGVASGTYDYFTEVIVGKEHSSRGDYTSSEDDNVLVQGVSSDQYALGFFGFAYYLENKDKLKAVAIDDGKDENGKGPQDPSLENVEKALYQPLARPLFVYVRKDRLDQSAPIKAFMQYYLDHGAELATEVGYINLPSDVQKLALHRFSQSTIGSIYAGKGAPPGMSLAELLKTH